jgi:hypothetical protein
MERIDYLPNVLKIIIKSIESYLTNNYPERTRTLPVSIKQRGKNSIITWNVFPDFENNLEEVYNDCQTLLQSELEKITDGELLEYNIGNGRILDAGLDAFIIRKGMSWDLYLYQKELLIYIRLLHETSKENPENEWLSIDIDLIEKSAWFLD